MARRDLIRADPPTAPALGDRRARVLALLQAAPGPIGVSDVATSLGLHPNTARFHLDALAKQGLAVRETEDRELPGRPRALYSASEESNNAGRRSYRLLAEILTSYLAGHTEQPAVAALQAGEAWGRFLTERPAPFEQVDTAAATAQLVSALDEIGFAPEPVSSGRKQQVLLHHCPFREAAETHRDVVCAVHLGLMRGVLSELGAPVDAARLDPFVEPNLCVTHLAARGAPDAGERTRRRRAS